MTSTAGMLKYLLYVKACLTSNKWSLRNESMNAVISPLSQFPLVLAWQCTVIIASAMSYS